MNLSEMMALINAQAGGGATPQEVGLALGWALDALSSKAAEASGPRMLYEWRLDLVVDQGTYPLPEGLRVIKAVWNDTGDIPWGYSRISVHAEGFIQDGTPISAYGGSGAAGYWVTHRKLHILPIPTESDAAKLRILGYGRPPVPREFSEEVAVPFEAERWVIARAALMRLPPPDESRLTILEAQLKMAEQDLREWLWNHSADVPPGPMEDGVLG